MNTGTDVSIRECRASGYPVVKHRGKTMDPKKGYWLSISNPEAWPYGYLSVQDRRRDDLPKPYAYAGCVSYTELWREFIKAGPGIKSFCDFENCPYPSPDENPSFVDFCSLAGTLHTYQGL